MSAAKTTAERVSDSNERKRAAGLREVRSLWAYPQFHAELRANAAALNASVKPAEPEHKAVRKYIDGKLQSARTEAAAKLTAKRTQPTTRRKK